MLSCISCGKDNVKRNQTYCSNVCQMDYRYRIFIADWKDGAIDGSIGINAKGISGHIRRYLAEKNIGACSICGWNKVNQFTGKIPLEVDHIDGNADNNSETNLRLICPNCHSLTASYRNLNKGFGRAWRRQKYIRSNI